MISPKLQARLRHKRENQFSRAVEAGTWRAVRRTPVVGTGRARMEGFWRQYPEREIFNENLIVQFWIYRELQFQTETLQAYMPV